MPQARSDPGKAVGSASHSSKADMVVEDTGDTPKINYKHCQDEELKNIAGPSCKKHSQSIKDKLSIEKSERTRKRWSTDKVLIRMVNKHGLKDWQTVACAIPGRNAQQCRVRWKFTLDPAINKQEWSQQEELRLIHAQEIYGNKWRKMVEHFPGRTSCAIKEHWRGPMKRKLNSYLESGLLEQLPDLPEITTVSQNSDLDILQECEGSSDRNKLSSVLPTSSKSIQRPSPKSKQGAKSKSKQGTSSKSKQGSTELCENTDTSEGESSEFVCGKEPDDHSGEVSQRIRDRLNERKRARKRLAFLSSPVELKVTAIEKSQRTLQKIEQMSPDVNNISPTVFQDFSPEVPSECANVVMPPPADSNHSKNVDTSSGTSDPFTLELHQVNVSDLLDMPYCDGLMIIPPGYPNDDDFI